MDKPKLKLFWVADDYVDGLGFCSVAAIDLGPGWKMLDVVYSLFPATKPYTPLIRIGRAISR